MPFYGDYVNTEYIIEKNRKFSRFGNIFTKVVV